MAIALDTLAYARRLREAGFSEVQAEGQAEALAAAMTDTLVTKEEMIELRVHVDAGFLAAKRDLQELEIRMDARFASVAHQFRELETRMDGRFTQMDTRSDARLADLERRLTVRLGTVTVAAVSVVSAIVKLL